jgi:hypothetical protein
LMRDPDDILAASRHVRTSLRLARRPRKYNIEERGPFTRDNLLEHLRGVGRVSSRKYTAGRRELEPTVNDYRKEFNGWQNALYGAFGRDLIDVTKVDHKYIYDVILQFDLWTLRDYDRKRADWPGVLPSKHVLLREWGRWSNLKACARRHSVALVLDDYLNLWRRLDHKPSLSDCREASLVIDKAAKFYGGKKKMDAFVTAMRRHE